MSAGRLAAASGLVLTSPVLWGAVAVTVAATVLETISGSTSGAASDGSAIDGMLRLVAVISVAGAGLLVPLIRSNSGTPTGEFGAAEEGDAVPGTSS
ncbi:hypothetical protein ABZ153_08350 [Streptomyces sp. NPDC006290]|uniref:hypothetical protein n=1 Tax=Streptomyces sp. NPDC006290 TaxID=3156745 RepID=UPI0033AC2451